MKLVKLQSLSNRPVTNVELLTKYVFGDNFPTKFVNNKYYNAGDYVYNISKTGDLQLYYCTISGTYDIITDEGWIVSSVPSVIQDVVNNYITENNNFYTINGNNSSNSSANGYNGSDLNINSKYFDVNTYIGNPDSYQYVTYENEDVNIDVDQGTAQLPFKYDPNLHRIEVYVDGYRLFESNNEFSIDGKTITINSDKLTADSKVNINVFNKFDNGAKLIYHEEIRPSDVAIADNQCTLTIPLSSKYIEKSLIFSIYYKNRYVTEEYYTYSYDYNIQAYKVVINMQKCNFIETSATTTDFMSDFMISTSKEVCVVKHDILEPITTETEKFNIDLKYTDFNKIQNIHNCYDNGLLIPNTATTLYNEFVHITDSDYAIKSNVFVISYVLILFTSIYESDFDGTNDFVDELTIPQAFIENRKVPVPFIGYNRDNGDMLLFNNSGKYISSTNYYVDANNMVNFYPSMALTEGTKILFALMDNDYSIHNYSRQLQLSEYDIDHGIKLPCLDFDQDAFDVMIFKSTGEYIPSIKYTLSDTNWLTFHADAGVSASDKIDIVMMEYCASRTKSLMRRFSIVPDIETSMQLPFTFYQNDDNVLVFSHDGILINPENYTITKTGVLTFKNGITVTAKEPVDVFLFRRHSGYKLVPDMKLVRKNISTINY